MSFGEVGQLTVRDYMARLEQIDGYLQSPVQDAEDEVGHEAAWDEYNSLMLAFSIDYPDDYKAWMSQVGPAIVYDPAVYWNDGDPKSPFYNPDQFQ